MTGTPPARDVAEALSPVKWFAGAEADGAVVRFRAEAGHRYLVASVAGLRSPRVVRPEGSLLRDARNRADCLLIAPAAFLGAAEPLLLRRAEQGLAVRAVSLEEIAAVFGHGRPSGEAIRSVLEGRESAVLYHLLGDPGLKLR